MNTRVSIPKIKAWIRPIKNSNKSTADWAKTGIRLPMTNRRTEPAKMLPNNRKPNERSFEVSEMSSRSPTPKSITPKSGRLKNVLKFKNLVKYERPRARMPTIWDITTENTARLIVKLRSVEATRTNGAKMEP